MKIFTIGFTQTTAQRFFERIKASGANKIVDVRLNNVSQLAGFAKRDDLRYFTSEICGIDYKHLPELAPTQEILDGYKKRKEGWDTYARRFLDLMSQRHIERLDPHLFDGACLLCSEHEPHHCHRRLVAEFLRDRWPSVEIKHL